MNTFFVHRGVIKRPRLIHKIIRVGKVYLMMSLRQAWSCLRIIFVASKKIEKLPKIPKIYAMDLGSSRCSTNLWRYKSIATLARVICSDLGLMQPTIKDVFITLESLWKSSRKMCAATMETCAAAFEHIFFVCGCFWEYFIFLKERAAASEGYQKKKKKKNVRLLLKQNVQLLLIMST